MLLDESGEEADGLSGCVDDGGLGVERQIHGRGGQSNRIELGTSRGCYPNLRIFCNFRSIVRISIFFADFLVRFFHDSP